MSRTNCRNKISINEGSKKDQEHKILSWFTLPQGLRLILCKLAKISTKKISKISLTQYNTCTPQANPAPNSNLPTEPHSSSSTSTKPIVLSSYNHTPYVICNNDLRVHESSMSRPNQTVILLKIDYKNIKNRVETLSSA